MLISSPCPLSHVLAYHNGQTVRQYWRVRWEDRWGNKWDCGRMGRRIGGRKVERTSWEIVGQDSFL